MGVKSTKYDVQTTVTCKKRLIHLFFAKCNIVQFINTVEHENLRP